MNTDFRVATDMPDHPKTVHLLNRCGDRGFVCLIRLWAWVAANRPDGRLGGLTDEAIEAKVEWNGEPGLFVKTLLECPPHCGAHHGFAERAKDGQLVLHDWSEHNTYAFYAPRRHRLAKRAAEARWNKNHKDSAPSNPERNADSNTGGNRPSPVPSPSPVPPPRGKKGAQEASRPHGAPTVPPPSSDRRKAKDELPDPKTTRADAPPQPPGTFPRRAQLYDICRREGLDDHAARAESYRRFMAEQNPEPTPQNSEGSEPDPGPPTPGELDAILGALGDLNP